MKLRTLLLLSIVFFLGQHCFSQNKESDVKENIPMDSIRLSDPFILADSETAMYYMTGTGGMLWKSKDLKYWTGPFHVAKADPESWMGVDPMIWVVELHQHHNKYYNSR